MQDHVALSIREHEIGFKFDNGTVSHLSPECSTTDKSENTRERAYFKKRKENWKRRSSHRNADVPKCFAAESRIDIRKIAPQQEKKL